MTDQQLREKFETLASDSYGFKRSRRGTYVNASVARDWKWFQLGAAAKATDTQEELDAKRWRAFLASERIRMIGSAGIKKPEHGNYAHFGMEIWTVYSRNYSPELLKQMDDGNELGRKWLTEYADVAIRALEDRAGQ